MGSPEERPDRRVLIQAADGLVAGGAVTAEFVVVFAPVGGLVSAVGPAIATRGRGVRGAAVYGIAYGLASLASLACTLPVFLVVVGSAIGEGISSPPSRCSSRTQRV